MQSPKGLDETTKQDSVDRGDSGPNSVLSGFTQKFGHMTFPKDAK